MQETEDIVARLELCAAVVRGQGKTNTAATMEEAATTIATLRAEVEGLRADAERWAAVMADLRTLADRCEWPDGDGAQVIAQLWAEGWIRKLDAAIDAAKADK